MKFNKELAEGIWLFYGERIVGGVLCAAGLVMVCKGARNYGFVRAAAALKSTSPETFDKLLDEALS